MLFKLRHSEDHACIETFLVGNLNAGLLDYKRCNILEIE